MSKETLMAEVDSIVRYIEVKVRFGTDKDEVIAEQAKSLLHTFSKLAQCGIELATATAVSNHIGRTMIWNITQLAAFKACLRAAITTRLHQPGSRHMQSMYIEDALIQADWDMLCAHPKIGVVDMNYIVAFRMHRYGIDCPDSATLARAGAIVEACAGTLPQNCQKWAFEMNTILNRLKKKYPWPFAYIQNYPRDPHELPQEVLDYACGAGVRPVPPPAPIKDPYFRLIVSRILSPRPPEAAHQVAGKWKSIQVAHRKGAKVLKWFESAKGGRLEPAEPNPADTEPATKKRPAARAATAATTKTKRQARAHRSPAK